MRNVGRDFLSGRFGIDVATWSRRRRGNRRHFRGATQSIDLAPPRLEFQFEFRDPLPGDDDIVLGSIGLDREVVEFPTEVVVAPFGGVARGRRIGGPARDAPELPPQARDLVLPLTQLAP